MTTSDLKSSEIKIGSPSIAFLPHIVLRLSSLPPDPKSYATSSCVTLTFNESGSACMCNVKQSA